MPAAGSQPACRNHRSVLHACAMVLLIAVSSYTPAADLPALEYQVKAAFLLNFARFIEWPETSFAGPHASFAICILGDDPFGPALTQIVTGETVGRRNLVVHRIRRLPEPNSCHVLYIHPAEKDIAKTLAGLGPGILTVGEGAPFLRDGGMIAFVVEDRRVRFDVNRRAAEGASLKISARLLAVARLVEK